MASPVPPISRDQRKTVVSAGQPCAWSGDGDSAGPYDAHREPEPAEWVLLARLIRPHGRKGELVAEVLTDFPERFHDRKRVYLIPPKSVGTRPREIRLESFWYLRSRIVLKFEGIDSINDAEPLRHFEVAIPHAERAPLERGAVYVSDLIGCAVMDLNREGGEIGEVVDVDRGSSSTELLVLRRRGLHMPDAEVLIPFVREYLVRIDVEARRIEMRLPEGLLDINAPLTEEEKRVTGSKS